MLRKRIFPVCLLLMAFVKPYAQVSLQTGSATFSLPMFSWQDDKSRLNAVVALSYNSGNGLKVNEVASNAGQGWNLVTGGEIVRMQVGEPDDQVAYNGTSDVSDYDITKYPSGILYATIPAANGCPNALTTYPIYGWKNQLYSQKNIIAEDKQLDYFSFQFNGKAGMFVLDPTNIGVAKPLGDTKMKITFLEDGGMISQGIRTKITSFNIQDVDGLIYKFTLHGLTKVLQTSYTDENFNYKQTQPKFKNDIAYYQSSFDNSQTVNPWIIGSWYLSEIEDGLTHRKIFFNYTTRNINNTAGEDISSNYTSKHYCIVSHKTSITQTPEISYIVYPDGHTVTFNYGAARIDLNGEYVLSSIDITYLGRSLSRYELNTSYFILNRYGTPVSDYQKKVARLCLLSVKKYGVDLKEDTPPYLFDYYTGSNTPDDFVPPPFFYAKDIWGFYNGDYSKGFMDEPIGLNSSVNKIKNCNQLRGLCFLHYGVSGVNLTTKAGYAKNGLLRQIIYPTGGTLTYQYDQNIGVLSGTTTNVGGVHVSQTSSTDGGYANGCANPIVTSYNYVMNGVGSASSLWGVEMPANSMPTNNHYQPEFKSYHWTPNCVPFGCCYWHFQYPGILSQQQAIDVTGVQHAMAVLSPVLGIISILSTIQDAATAFTGGSPVAVIIDVITGLAELGLTCIGNQSRENTGTIYFNSDMNGAAPLPAQFKRVEVVESPGTIGKTVQEFTSDNEYPIWVQSNPVFSAKQRFAPWAYGLPQKTTIYDASNNIIKETINKYKFDNTQSIIDFCSNNPHFPCYPPAPPGIYSTLVSCKCLVTKSSSLRSTKWTDPATYNPGYLQSSNTDMQVDFYQMYSGRTELDSTIEKQYKQGSQTDFLASSTKYTYDPNIYEVSSINTVNSNGDKISKSIRYSAFYNGGIFDILNQNNIINIPVSTATLLIPTTSSAYNYPIDNNNYYYSLYWANAWFATNEKVTEFTTLANGDIRPGKVIEQRFDKPLVGAVGNPNFTPYPGPQYANYSNYKTLQTFSYDNNSNLTGIKDEGNRTISNIYDYNDKYIVASVINADPVVDKSAYSSFETTGLGNWTLTGSPVYVTTSSITGTTSFTLSSGVSLSVSALNTAKPYTVSFWATTSGITVTGGATLTKSAPTINGFTYYEYDISQGTSSVTVAGSGNIDELRLYPKTARMRTTTYDPLIGKTSDCDENNRITYYEYDNLGRLRFVKDENKNIVKMQEYNNVSAAKQNGCPGAYYNHLISEVFTRNNCGSGYLGADVIYTVAANTYSSSVSQADADAQAENNLLTNGQTYANTNGACQLIYYNASISITDTTQNCTTGYVGGLVTYSVPAGRYTSLISQADADDKANDELQANAQAYANDPAHAICTINTDPDWTWLEGAAWYCQYVGRSTYHLFVLETDTNPNSSSYNQTRWSDTGPSDMCPGTYSNTVQSQSFTRNNCAAGYVGSTVTYSVAAGTYSSGASQAAADQLATDDINANGQNYANTNGTCTLSGGCGTCTGDDKKCINNICETGTWAVVSSVYKKVLVDGFLQWRWVCTYRYCFSDGSQSTYSQDVYYTSPCTITCYAN